LAIDIGTKGTDLQVHRGYSPRKGARSSSSRPKFTLYSAAAAQGPASRGFAAARQAVARIPRENPARRPTISAPQFARPIVAMEFNLPAPPTSWVPPVRQRPAAATATIHWVEPAHRPRINLADPRDQAGLRQAPPNLLAHVHTTAMGGVSWMAQHTPEDPTIGHYPRAAVVATT